MPLPVSGSVLTRARSACPASSCGLRVVPLTTSLSMCTRHIWKGMPSNAVLIPPNPSAVTERIVYPRRSSSCLHSRYTWVVSVFVNVHHRFSIVCTSRATMTHHDVSSFRSPKYEASTTKYTARRQCLFWGNVYVSNRIRIVRLSFLYCLESSLSVCLPKTYRSHSCLIRDVWVLLASLKYLPQILQKYVWIFLLRPRLIVCGDEHLGHLLCFFNHYINKLVFNGLTIAWNVCFKCTFMYLMPASRASTMWRATSGWNRGRSSPVRWFLTISVYQN